MSDQGDRLQQIRERAEKATPGQWLCIKRNVWAHDVYVSPDEGGNPEAGALLASVATNRPAGEANPEFIAHAREDIPWLLDHVSTLTASLASLEREREDWMQRAKDYRAALLQEKAESDRLRSEVARLTTAPEKVEP
jgi:hypothetical protein